MKSIILIFTLFFITLRVSAQSFAPIGAKWYYSSAELGAGPNDAAYYLYESKQEINVFGHPGKIISVTYYRSFYKFHGDTVILPPVYIYQSFDTVFYYNNVYHKYFPLYIFNVKKGDTINYHCPEVPLFKPNDTIVKSVIDSVTNFIVGSDTLKRIWSHEFGAFSFYGGYTEKIGSRLLMLHQPQMVIPEWDGPLRCYSDSDISYNTTQFPCDYRMRVGLEEMVKPIGLLIYPNPSTNQIHIQIISNQKQAFNIYNSMGQKIMNGVLESNLTTIDTDALNSGIYSFELISTNNTQRKRFIVDK
ncbi:MAG: T9SS type A sorting domain-containing protein [Bacteroidota bacterium]|nr:T9SS type A sorting domain-containing protein [Bacteroidota bacterium]